MYKEYFKNYTREFSGSGEGIPLDIQTWDASTWRIIFSLLSATP